MVRAGDACAIVNQDVCCVEWGAEHAVLSCLTRLSSCLIIISVNQSEDLCGRERGSEGEKEETGIRTRWEKDSGV